MEILKLGVAVVDTREREEKWMRGIHGLEVEEEWKEMKNEGSLVWMHSLFRVMGNLGSFLCPFHVIDYEFVQLKIAKKSTIHGFELFQFGQRFRLYLKKNCNERVIDIQNLLLIELNKSSTIIITYLNCFRQITRLHYSFACVSSL